ncbi:sodium:solute symporter family protein [Synoicihabitans lomoniglobus]|uniref:Na+:solute symporter n=1 Tax=Synoicihabitans lomoniglobus TaxID=2909285 RepID=A0AAF0CNY7_9BACT|nr:Na+:solute symporter [Opitutaceae bacterium LMO-M01]WED65090.1 Na+:solute symporter [Opitutaceae bacterium LMO-M01]
MEFLDYTVIGLYFLLVVGIGVMSYRKVKGSRDFFVAGGKIPWWLGGVSHHVSGYSGVVFVGYAAIAYEYGFTLYVWWAGSIIVACVIGALVFAPRWARLRMALAIESPTEYLAMRYGVATQQVMAWSGVLLKLFDVGAKWASIGILLHGFTGLPLTTGILLSGVVSLCYITVGGLWADLYNDFAQFFVQVAAGLVLFVTVARHLGGVSSVATIWERLPSDHGQLFNGPYTPLFLVGFVMVATMSSNGGTWNLAARYIGAPSAASARKTALLSGALYLVWPLVLFFPMWAAPLLLPNIADPSQSYVLLVRQYLPAGLVGLVLASMFAATTSMTSSDTNTISSVVTRDILPVLSAKFRDLDQRQSLRLARLTTLAFMAATLLIGIEAERFGGVLGLIISWFGALIGPVSVPMLFGLLPVYRTADARAAIGSILAGFAGFVVVTYGMEAELGLRILVPIASSITVFSAMAGWRRKRPVPRAVAKLMQGLSSDAVG